MKAKYLNRNRDPREITARFDSVCSESGRPIKKGETIIYYPTSKSVFKLDTNQAQEFYSWKQDLLMGHDY